MSRLCVLFFLAFFNFGILANPSVVIIGAGPSGIAAATKLLQNGIHDIKILEAEDRIGGRINSVHFSDGIVDLGAQYCHGEKGNVAYNLAKDLDVLEPGLRSLQNNVYYSNGSRLDPDLIEELRQVYLKYDQNENYDTKGKSLGDVFIQKYNTTLFPKHLNSETESLLSEGLRFLEGYVLIHEGAFSWFNVSADCDYVQCEGNQALTWKGGYKTVLKIMMDGLPIDEKIRLKTRVEQINWDKNTVTVLASNNRTYSADYAIFTPSVGVLKRHKLFTPNLPIAKQKSVEATGFEGVMKVFLHFPQKWWGDSDQAFAFFWSQKDLKLIWDKPWVTQVRYILKVPHNSNVWVAWITGDLVPEIEKLPLEVFKIGVKFVLERFLNGKYHVTEIGDVLRSNWCTNPNFGGTYSFTRVGFYNKGFSHQEKLAEPLLNEGKPVVLFAGEATHPVHFQTVHGAIETGYREAERIIRIHNHTNKI
ncbi:spermine oxidase [Tribolium castaneum]|uniref:spermine oxidase n=1 Tax=Tribolium castaneum TaxID=7070 RepID=UPI0030FEC874